MKKLKTRIGFLLMTALLLVTGSCREEEFESLINPPEETLEANSSVASVLQNTASKDGSEDNIIDNASCLSLVLPVTVIVNGQEITVNTLEDLDTVEDILDEFDDDEDTVEIVFPIRVVLADFTEIQVNSLEELETLAEECGAENQVDDDIECADIVYPVTASVFNTNNELINTLTFNSDQELYEFIDDLEEEDIVELDFPITVVLFDGTSLQAGSLTQLEAILENARDACDEDDDNDYDDDDCDNCTTAQFTDILLGCSDWRVDKLERNDEDLEDLYFNYRFNFSADGSLSATAGAITYSGTWMSQGSSNSITVEISIPELPDFNNSWILHELDEGASETDIDLRLQDDRLRFESSCSTDGNGGGDGGGGADDSALVTALTAGDWYITNYFDDVDQTSLFSGQVFNFATDGGATANDGTTTTEGNWFTGSGDETVLELNLNFGTTAPFDELLEDWDVLEVTNDIIRLKDISGGDGSTDFLTFERDPNSEGNGGIDLNSALTDGLWIVGSYLDDGIEQTSTFNGYTLDFITGGTVSANNGSAFDGSWQIQSGGSKLFLDFGGQVPLDELNDDWDVLSVSETQIELFSVSGGDGTTDTLTLLKQ